MKKVAFIFHDTNLCSGATKSLLDVVASLDKNEIKAFGVLPEDNNEFIRNLNEIGVSSIVSFYHRNTYTFREMKNHPVECIIRKQLVRVLNIFCVANLVYFVLKN